MSQTPAAYALHWALSKARSLMAGSSQILLTETECRLSVVTK